ncbi:unnamed protein product [Ectocarpus sp. 12 AP-2014]
MMPSRVLYAFLHGSVMGSLALERRDWIHESKPAKPFRSRHTTIYQSRIHLQVLRAAGTSRSKIPPCRNTENGPIFPALHRYRASPNNIRWLSPASPTILKKKFVVIAVRYWQTFRRIPPLDRVE